MTKLEVTEEDNRTKTSFSTICIISKSYITILFVGS